ncbi:MAG TPA: MBL fold metallo-hydrolase [Candidatus Limnocylindrales bacterium]|jgi:ribonuclease BN (tRNA processing enzyme)
MELIVLGAGPAYTDRPGALGAAYLLRMEGGALLLDLGQGAFPALVAQIPPETLDGIVISHLHPDHFIDLVALRHYLRYQFRPPRRLTVHAPAALADRIDALHGEPGFTAAVLDLAPLAPGERRVGRFVVQAARVTHTDDSYGFRVAPEGGGPGLVYSGDCGVAGDLRPLVREGDALLSEVSFGAEPVPGDALHLNAPAVGDLAATTRAGRVLLTHIQMGFDRQAALDAVRAAYPGPVEFVDPGTRIRLD